MPLYRPSELSAFIQKCGLRPNKALSQHFLIDGNVLQKILHVSQITPGDCIVEIGSGPGALTEALLQAGAQVIAIEKDPLFASELQRLHGDLTIYQADILSFPLEEILQGRHAKVVANLPYQITTPILQKLLPMHQTFHSLTVMVQREFGERLCSKPRTSSYGSITLFAKYYADARFGFLVKPGSFHPRPSVDSCVVYLQLENRAFSLSPEQFFFISRRSFAQRRKMLRSSLKNYFPVDLIECSLVAMGLPTTARPEELSFEEFHLLAQNLYSSGFSPVSV